MRSLRPSAPHDRLLFAPEGGGGLPGVPGSGSGSGSGSQGSGSGGSSLPGVPGSGSAQPGPPSFEKQPAAGSSSGGLWGGDAGERPGGGAPVFQQPAPTQVPQGGTFELSGWWRRVGAYVLDGIIISVLAIPFALVLFAIFGASFDEADWSDSGFALAAGGTAIVLMLLAFLIAAVLYAPFFMSRWDGATPGKRALGIRVVRADGLPITFGFAAVREVAVKGLLLNAVSQITFGFAGLLNYLWPLWDSEHRALHDMLVKTRVVRA